MPPNPHFAPAAARLGRPGAALPKARPAPTARPARFRQARVLIVGCGDVGRRAARLLAPRVRLLALNRRPEQAAALRAQGITPIAGDLDQPATLRRLPPLAARLLHLAPPPPEGEGDPRSLALARALRRARGRKNRRLRPIEHDPARQPMSRLSTTRPLAALIYGSTSGVYGDAGGQWVSETRPARPQTGRARRRLAAEQCLRPLGATVLRIPGIYAPDRPRGTPRQRLLRRTPALAPADDVFTSHIHAHDLARACALSLWRARPQRVLNISDERPMKMGDYFDLAARLYALPAPPRIPRAQAEATLSEPQMSFMRESRRLLNHRMKRELRLRLRYPSAQEGLQSGKPPETPADAGKLSTDFS